METRHGDRHEENDRPIIRLGVGFWQWLLGMAVAAAIGWGGQYVGIKLDVAAVQAQTDEQGRNLDRIESAQQAISSDVRDVRKEQYEQGRILLTLQTEIRAYLRQDPRRGGSQ